MIEEGRGDKPGGGAPDARSAGVVAGRARRAGALLVVLILYAVLAALAHRYAYFEWDLRLERGIQSIHGLGFAALMRWVSLPGDGWAPFILVIVTGVSLLAA